jgi:hypothetical protein
MWSGETKPLHPTKSLFIFAITRLPGTAPLSLKASSTFG